jgi:cytochrome P450
VLWGLRYQQFTRAAHRRFGPTVTVRPGTMPPAVLTTEPHAIRAVFTGDPLDRHHGNDVLRPLIGDRSILLLEPSEHLARRRLLLPPFHGERVRGYAELMQGLMDREVARWSPGDIVALLPVAQNVTIEVILQAVLGVHDADTRQRFRRLIDNLLYYPLGALRLQIGKRVATRVAAPGRIRTAAAFASSLLSPAVSTYFPELKIRSRLNFATWGWWRQRDRLIALLDEHIAATREDPRLGEREDVLAMLVQARDEDGSGLSTADLRDDLIALIGAGHETTAAVIAWGGVLLAHNDAVRERATTAARAGDDDYLSALVKEVLRIRTPLPAAAGRVLAEPLTTEAGTIPAGTVILIDAWAIHHDADLYPDPERFLPDRFLGDSPGRYTWLPFGGGAHRCIGAGMAELEIKIALGTILRNVDIQPADRALAPVARRGVTFVPHGGGRIRIA